METVIDVLICHPRLVQTDLYLTDFPAVVPFEDEDKRNVLVMKAQQLKG